MFKKKTHKTNASIHGTSEDIYSSPLYEKKFSLSFIFIFIFIYIFYPQGVYDAEKNAIKWPDGNQWTKL